MEDETVRIAADLRLGTTLCRSHLSHHCGSEVYQHPTHGLSCRYSEGRQARHVASQVSFCTKLILGSNQQAK